MLKLHIWWDFSRNEPSLISPECVALYKYIQHYTSKNELPIEIVGSNNLDLYGGGYDYPLLVVDGDNYITGYFNIILYLHTTLQKETIEQDCQEQITLQDKMLLNYICNNLTLLTEYQLFLNLDNYKLFTKPLLVKLFPFPFNWLNDPMRLRNRIESKLNKYLKIGYVNEDETLVDEEPLDEFDENGVEYISHDENFDENMKKYLVDNKKENKLSILKYKTQYQSLLQGFMKIFNKQTDNGTVNHLHYSIKCLMDVNMDLQLNQLPNSHELQSFVPNYQMSTGSEYKQTQELVVSKPVFKESNFYIWNKLGFS